MVNEGGQVSVSVELSRAADRDLTVDIETNDLSAIGNINTYLDQTNGHNHKLCSETSLQEEG